MKTIRILIDIDALYDTKLQVYKGLFKEDNDAFNKLLSDWCGTDTLFDYKDSYGVSREAFIKAYEGRTKTLLKQSDFTSVVALIDTYNQASEQSTESVGKYHYEIIINAYPYTLNDEEIAIMKANVASFISHSECIAIIRKTREDLTPTYLKSQLNIDDWWCVDPDGWLYSSIEKFVDTESGELCPDINMITPYVFDYTNTNINTETKGDLSTKNNEQFKQFKPKIFGPLINITYVDTLFFRSAIAVKAREMADKIDKT